MKVFNFVSDKSEVPSFITASMVLLAGALLTIVLGTVFAVLAVYSLLTINALLIMAIHDRIVQDIAGVLLTTSFFRIRAPPTQIWSTLIRLLHWLARTKHRGKE